MARALLEYPRTDALAPSSSADLVRHSDTADAPVAHRALAAPGDCDACHYGWALLENDALSDGHYERALSYKDHVQTYIKRHPHCTMDDLRGHFGCADAALRICLHLLVDRHEIQALGPYACGASQGHD
jgi:hypothetical protein